MIILSCSIATIIGGLLIPSFQRILSIAVDRFSIYRSVPKVIFHGFTKTGLSSIKESIVLPSPENLKNIYITSDFPWKVFLNERFCSCNNYYWCFILSFMPDI